MIGKLLGHTQVQTTARYAHLGRNSVKVAAVRISDSLEADMDTPPTASVPLDLNHSCAAHPIHMAARDPVIHGKKSFSRLAVSS